MDPRQGLRRNQWHKLVQVVSTTVGRTRWVYASECSHDLTAVAPHPKQHVHESTSHVTTHHVQKCRNKEDADRQWCLHPETRRPKEKSPVIIHRTHEAKAGLMSAQFNLYNAILTQTRSSMQCIACCPSIKWCCFNPVQGSTIFFKVPFPRIRRCHCRHQSCFESLERLQCEFIGCHHHRPSLLQDHIHTACAACVKDMGACDRH